MMMHGPIPLSPHTPHAYAHQMAMAMGMGMSNMSPLHHPTMGSPGVYGMYPAGGYYAPQHPGNGHGVPLTPYGLPPITPSMPPFSFSQPHSQVQQQNRQQRHERAPSHGQEGQAASMSPTPNTSSSLGSAPTARAASSGSSASGSSKSGQAAASGHGREQPQQQPSNGRLFRGGAAFTPCRCLDLIVYSLLHHAAYNSMVHPTHGHRPARPELSFEYDVKFASPRRESCSISRRTNIVAEQSSFSESSMGVFNTLRLFSSNQVYVYLRASLSLNCRLT